MASPGRCSRPAYHRVSRSWSIIPPVTDGFTFAEIDAMGSDSPSIAGSDRSLAVCRRRYAE
jgi:hypothetical protein